MKHLLRLTGLIEAATGLALIVVPGTVVQVLLGAEVAGASIPLARLVGMALFALGVACWIAQYDVQAWAARGVVSAMMLYNMGAVVILGAAGLWSRPVGLALWPAVGLHVVMMVWCTTCLRRGPVEIVNDE